MIVFLGGDITGCCQVG